MILVSTIFTFPKQAQLVSAPDIYEYELTDDDEYLIIVSEGIQKVLTSQQVLDLIRCVFVSLCVDVCMMYIIRFGLRSLYFAFAFSVFVCLCFFDTQNRKVDQPQLGALLVQTVAYELGSKKDDSIIVVKLVKRQP